MYKLIPARNLASGQRFMIAGNSNWLTTGNEPYMWEGYIRVPCTQRVNKGASFSKHDKNAIKSLLLKLPFDAKVKVWS